LYWLLFYLRFFP